LEANNVYYFILSLSATLIIAEKDHITEKSEASHIILIRSQSGQIQVGPLLIPHLFSSKHSLQIIKPQGQLQQNSCFFLQQWHTYSPIFLFL